MNNLRVFILISIIFSLNSCAGYFHPQQQDDIRADRLALVNGGTLSETLFNDVTPFIYTSTNGHKYLFFASDRPLSNEMTHNFNIWYSLMQGDVFTKPRFLTPVANTTNDEVRPIVIDDQGSTYITFLRGTNREVHTYQLHFDGYFITNESSGIILGGVQDSRLTYIERSGRPILMTSSNSQLALEFYFTNGKWQPARGRYFNLPIGTGHGFTCTGGNYPGEWYIFEVQIGNNWEITRAFVNNGDFGRDTLSGFFSLSEYSTPSISKDRAPFVDKDNSKVYFSSDRYHINDKYDLYRFNEKLYHYQKTYKSIDRKTLLPGVYVAANAPLTGNGLSPDSPLPSIPEAIMTAQDQGLTNIYVTAGTYNRGNQGLDPDKTLPGFILTNDGFRIIGGFDNTYSWRQGLSILDGTLASNSVVLVSNVHSVVLDGFRITGGYNDMAAGSGLRLYNVSNSVFNNLQVMYNTNIGWGGGGVYVNGKYNILDLYIAYNYSSANGGGLRADGSIEGNRFFGHIINNNALGLGGGIFIETFETLEFRSVISNNNAGSSGGGVYDNWSGVNFGNSLNIFNTPDNYTGGA